MNDYTEDQARADADALVARISTDTDFVAQLQADPHATLLASGIPDDVVGNLEKALQGAEVEGFGFKGAAHVPGQYMCSRAFEGFINVAVSNGCTGTSVIFPNQQITKGMPG